MSGNLQEQAKTFENKIKDISEYLKSNVLSPAEQEKEKILADANAEKERIIAQADKKAEQIVRAAEEKARHTLSTMESSLRLAARQSVDTLKIALEKEVFAQTAGAALKGALTNTEVMKNLLSEVIRQTAAAGAGQVAIALSDDMKKQLGDFVKGEIAAKGAKGMALSDEKVPAGFTVIFKDKGFAYEFTPDALTELMGEFLRAEIRSYLFK
ncbi:MAG TPA: hypothetical protein PLV42_13230 [bacterium]|nr:hypothetical protein [bacterium]